MLTSQAFLIIDEDPPDIKRDPLSTAAATDAKKPKVKRPWFPRWVSDLILCYAPRLRFSRCLIASIRGEEYRDVDC